MLAGHPLRRRQKPAAQQRSRSSKLQDDDDEATRVKKIGTWIGQHVIGNGPSSDTTSMYAQKLFDEGFESIAMVKAELGKDDINSYDWMKTVYKRKFLGHIERGW